VRVFLLGVAVAAVSSSYAVAQPPVGRVGVAGVLQHAYAGSKADLTREADLMPEVDYSLKVGTMPEVRTFGQLFGHVAAAQFGTCAAVKGVPNPMAGKSLEDFKTKAEFVNALADSFTFCDEAFSSTTDENAMQFVKQGPNELPRAAVLFGLLAHNAEMYGIGTVYLRLKGLVPPSTERANARRRGGP
jgi:hypothetical protein